VIHGFAVETAKLNAGHSSSVATEQKHVVTILDDKWPCGAVRESRKPSRAATVQSNLNIQLVDSFRLFHVHKMAEGSHRPTLHSPF
jgi:hypothetical protein